MKALQRYADKAPYQHFFTAYDQVYGKDIEKDLKIRAKKEDRERRIAAGENVSDTSSTKERKKIEREELLTMIRKQSTL